MHGQNHPSEQPLHLAPALTAVILGVVALAAFGSYARSLEYRSIRALAADEQVFQTASKLSAIKNQGTALQLAAVDTSGLLPIYGLGAEPASDLQPAVSSDQLVPRLPYRVHSLPGGQARNDLLGHPPEAGSGRPRA